MKCFLTGCDKNTEWQLPWFIENYKKHCDVPLVIADFGMTQTMLDTVTPDAEEVIKASANGKKGWFGKVNAMMKMKGSRYPEGICWIDTDCQIVGDPAGLFDCIENNKLAIVKDHPWSSRRNIHGDWYNTGVVAFKGRPNVLVEWRNAIQDFRNNLPGDQETLYELMNEPLKVLTNITPLPHKYNVLRLDYIDNNVPNDVRIVHHTGEKGNDKIRSMMNA